MWLTRLTVPAELRQILNKRELKRSLKTKIEREARLLHPVVLAEFQAELERARRILESDSLLTDAVIQSIVFDWRKSVATSFANHRDAVNPYLNRYAGVIEENNAPIGMILNDLSNLDAQIQMALDEGNILNPELIAKKHERYYKQLDTLLTHDLVPYLVSFKIEPNLRNNSYRKLLYDFAIAYVEITQSALKREASNINLIKQGAELQSESFLVDVQGVTVE